MIYYVLNTVKIVIATLGLHAIFGSWLIAAAGILVEGAIASTIWFLSGFWYVLFELFYTKELSAYGWWMLGVSCLFVVLSIMSPKFGYKWSLYFVEDGKLKFALHENSPIRLLGYIITYYEKGKYPLSPWEIHLNFNPSHTSIKIEPKYFTKTGLSEYLIGMIKDADPDFMRKGGDPYFVNVLTNKEIPMKHSNLSAIMDGEVAYHDIMNKIFKSEMQLDKNNDKV